MINLSCEERLERAKHPLLKKLFQIMTEKKSNLCVAADFPTFKEIIEFVEKCGQHICILKTHLDQYGWVTEDDMKQLYKLKKKYNFLLFEDVKFVDHKQVTKTIYSNRWVKYVDLVTIFPIHGEFLFEAIHEAVVSANLPPDEPRGCLAVCEVSYSDSDQINPNKLLDRASKNSNICIGVIAQDLLLDDCQLIKATPGVHLTRSKDESTQKWRTPETVMSNGTDIIIVGRGITQAKSVEDSVLEYKKASYEAYAIRAKV